MARYKFWVSCLNFTCVVEVENGKIVAAAPMIQEYVGESFEKLLVDFKIDRISLIKGGQNVK